MTESAYHDAPKLNPDFFNLYLRRMDAGQRDKMLAFTRMLDAILRDPNTPIAISTGAGSGKIEISLARAYPTAHIVALDYSFPMIETIQGTIEQEKNNGNLVSNISVLQASAEHMPIAPKSVMAVLAPSFIHELASFCDGYTFGTAVDRYVQSAVRSLKKGGRFVIRDFMAPDKPDEQRILRIGEKIDPGDAEPTEFLLKFVNTFRGWSHPEDQENLRKQIQNLQQQERFGKGGELYISFRTAMEIAGHYSWALRFDDEIKERYEYHPPKEYSSYVIEQGKKVGVTLVPVVAESWHQPGYTQHVAGRLDFFHEDGRSSRTPVFTGLVAVERTE